MLRFRQGSSAAVCLVSDRFVLLQHAQVRRVCSAAACSGLEIVCSAAACPGSDRFVPLHAQVQIG
jgi:hypothetical protein